MTRSALELIGQSGLGYSFDSLTEDGVPHPSSVAAKSLGYVYFPNLIGHRILWLRITQGRQYIQDDILFHLCPAHMPTDRITQVPTIYREYSPLEPNCKIYFTTLRSKYLFPFVMKSYANSTLLSVVDYVVCNRTRQDAVLPFSQDSRFQPKCQTMGARFL